MPAPAEQPRSRKPVVPPGRLGVRAFCTRAGIGYSEFYRRYRKDETYQQRWDMKEDAKGRINLSAAAADAQALISAGRAVGGYAACAPLKRCGRCGHDSHVRRNACAQCGATEFTKLAKNQPAAGGDDGSAN